MRMDEIFLKSPNVTLMTTQCHLVQKQLQAATELVQNSWEYFFTFGLMEAATGQKHTSDAENGMKE